MPGKSSHPYLAFVFRPEEISGSIDKTFNRTYTRAIFDISGIKLGETAEILHSAGVKDIKVSLKQFMEAGLEKFLDKAEIDTLWLEYHPTVSSIDLPDFSTRLRDISSKCRCIPIVSDVTFLISIYSMENPPDTIALKGSEASGIISTETTGILFSTIKKLERSENANPRIFVWGGIATPEASAAFLCSGAEGIVFESLHWLTDSVSADEKTRTFITKLRPEHTTVAGLGLGMPVRVFDKGNSKAAKELRQHANSLSGSSGKDRGRTFGNYFSKKLIHPLESDFKNNELIPLGPEAAFAESFAERFGRSTSRAITSFSAEISRLCKEAQNKKAGLKSNKLSKKLGTRHPIIQGAMSWISDVPEFALAVAKAGALPTFALGLKEAEKAEQDLNHMEKIMGGLPYAVNIITLSENPFRKEQLELIEKKRPPYVVIAAGEPSHAVQILQKGIEVIYVAPDQGLLKMALEAGVKYIIIEGNEAGGHVGEFSTLTLSQVILEMKRKHPSLFADKFIVHAGGIFDCETAFRAAMLDADGIQMGTPYLATKEIVSTGALSQLYQSMILDSAPGMTLVSGETIGLRVRSLKTSKMEAISELEKNFIAGKEDEASFRKRLEEMSAGSLFIAARGKEIPGGTKLDEKTCIKEGQFMSGASAGTISQTYTVDELHRRVAEGPFDPIIPHMEGAEPKPQFRPASRNGRERFAITGMSIVNSLGNSPQEVWNAVLGLNSGVIEVPPSRIDLGPFYDPEPMVPGKTYCKIGAFQNIEISRKELGVSPHDFRTMAQSTRLTLWLARNAINDSGIMNADITKERIGVLISQNSGEVASTISDLSIQVSIHEILGSIKKIFEMTPEMESAAKQKLKSEYIEVDDTTLLGRLNCAAGGFICNEYGFMGPSYSVSAACATSLVALYNAVQMIKNGVIDAAIVGGGEELLRSAHFLEFSALGALAGISGIDRVPSEYCRPLDADRDGMVLGEGGGIIIIERESVAKKRGANIHAYITGIGASNNNQGMIESLARSQEISIRQSFIDASYGPGEVDLVECHATSTKQGDVEEIKALKSFFPEGKKTVLTSFKSQIGHTLGASGINSLIRGIMAMQSGVFPPTINYKTPDPEIDLESWGFNVPTQPTDWKKPPDRPRRFMVNAFGFGGANYVVQLEECMNGTGVVLPSKRILESQAHEGQSEKGETLVIEGVSFLRPHIKGESYRVGVVAKNDNKAITKLALQETLDQPGPLSPKDSRILARQGIFISPSNKMAQPLAFVFAGQGTHYPGMGKDLYETFPLIRQWMDKIAKVADFDILNLLFNSKEEDLQKTRWQQPAMFTMEYAMVQHLISLGISPSAMAGHSLGELVALCVAGVFSYEDGFRIVNKRAECMDKAAGLNVDPGIMFATDTPQKKLDKMISGSDNIYFTNFNSPTQTVLGGDTKEALALMEKLKDEGHRATQLKVSMAFHSPIMKVIHDELESYIADIRFNPPKIPVVSNTTMKPYPQDPDRIKGIVMAHLESPVHWMQNVETLFKDYGINLFVEIGPRDTLCSLITETLEGPDCIVTCQPEEESSTFRAAAAKLFSLGHLKSNGSPVSIDSKDVSSEVTNRSTSAISGGNSILSVVQKEINSFVLESFGKYLKPQIVQAVRREVDPSFTEEKLSSFLGAGLSGTSYSQPAGVESSTPGVSSDAIGYPREQNRQFVPEENNLLEGVIKIIMDATGYDRDEIEPDMDIRQDLAIRSSRLPVIMDSAEQRFGIKINIEDFIGVRTVREMSDRIAKVKGNNAVIETSPSNETKKALATSGVRPLIEDLEAENMPQKEPIKRFIFGEVPIDETAISRLELQQGEVVAVLSPGPGCSLANEIVEYIKDELGAIPLILNYFNKDGADNGYDICKSGGRDKLSEKLADSDTMTGLVIILDPKENPVAGEMVQIPHLLTGFFQSLQSLLRSQSKKFCLAVTNRPVANGHSEVAFEGILGMLLAAAQEYASVLFRGVSLDADTNIKDAMDKSLSAGTGVTQLIFNGQDPFTLEARVHSAPIDGKPELELGAGDVVILSGGGKGITSHLARALGPFNPHLVLLGRSEPDPLIAHNLHDMNNLGIDVSYMSCDVTDSAKVADVVGRIIERFGKIDGIIHGAGILKDSFAELMSASDFEQVLNVKILGAWNLYQSARPHGLRFMVPLSSITAFQGNVGQANYCAANRALSALMNVIGREQDTIVSKAFILPPIEGAGMADDPEMKELLKLRDMDSAYVHVNELGQFFCRELFLGPRDQLWVMPARALPETKTARINRDEPKSDGAFSVSGFTFNHRNLPMIQEIDEIDFEKCELEASRTFSLSHDIWIEDHRPFQSMKYPLVSGIMAVETFLEAGHLLYPHLKILGVRKVEYRDIIECPPGIDRKVRIACRKTDGIQLKSLCQISISSQDISPTGRLLDSWSANYEGQVILGGWDKTSINSADLNILPDYLDTPPMNRSDIVRWYEARTALNNRYRVIESINGSGPDVITGSTVYNKGEDFAGLGSPIYLYSPYLFEALMHLASLYIVIRDKKESRTAIPAGIEEMRFARKCMPGEQVQLEARMRLEDASGHQWDARAVDKNGTTIMIVKGLAMKWLPN
ncbi:SDR family NAD(P)-dependent oxidoreductase [Thermodesulfobacteriota bacterium]